MSLFHPVSTSEKPNHQGFPYLNVQVSPAERPAAKSFSIVDVQILVLMLMILTVVSMPIYRSVLESQRRQTPSPIAVAHTAPIKTARSGIDRAGK